MDPTEKHLSIRPPIDALALARLAELQRLVVEAERHRSAESPLTLWPFALGGFLALAAPRSPVASSQAHRDAIAP